MSVPVGSVRELSSFRWPRSYGISSREDCLVSAYSTAKRFSLMPDQPPQQLPALPHRQVDVNIQQSSHPIDVQRFDPWWLRVASNTSAVTLMVILFAWTFVRQQNNDGRDAERAVLIYQQAQDRDEKAREIESARMRDWMKAKDERIGLEIEKLKLEVKIVQEQLKTATELVRAIHERSIKPQPIPQP